MTTRRKTLVAIGLSAFSAAIPALAQQSGKVRHIGFLSQQSRVTPVDPDVVAFVQGMRELGYVEGKNLVIEWRFADDKFERLAILAAELVQLNVEVIVTGATPGTRAAQSATRTIPIVFSSVTNPDGRGIVASLARPGGNITGSANFAGDLIALQYQMLGEIIPKLSRVGILGNHDGLRLPPSGKYHGPLLDVASKQGARIIEELATNSAEITSGIAALVKARVQAVIFEPTGLVGAHKKQILELLEKHRLPSAFSSRASVEAGGLLSYGSDTSGNMRRTSAYVAKILNGASPAELPVEQPTKLDLTINMKTAKALGLTIPPSILLRADKVIE